MGDPTETAIVRLAMEKGIDYQNLGSRYKKVAEIPFLSARKMMTNVIELEDGYLVLTKGAFDRLPFDRSDRNYMYELERVHDGFAKDALRVIALASKKIDRLPADIADVESGLTFDGFVGIIDPPRPEAAAAIAKAKAAGIRTVMITGRPRRNRGRNREGAGHNRRKRGRNYGAGALCPFRRRACRQRGILFGIRAREPRG